MHVCHLVKIEVLLLLGISDICLVLVYNVSDGPFGNLVIHLRVQATVSTLQAFSFRPYSIPLMLLGIRAHHNLGAVRYLMHAEIVAD